MSSFHLKVLRAYTTKRRLGSRFLRKLSELYIDVYDGHTYDTEHNGEAWLVRQLGDDLKVVFDVGANTGNYLDLVREVAPSADIHAFEIIADTFAELKRSHPSEPFLNPFGLSATAEKTVANFDTEKPESTRIVIDDRVDHDGLKRVEIETRRGDEYCREGGVTRIDLLKIDVEGAEHLVFDGFGPGLSDLATVIQFEYNRARIHSGTLLIDFYSRLEKDYALGRLTPLGVNFKPYSLEDEDFLGPNYVAVRRTEPELIKRLSAPAG